MDIDNTAERGDLKIRRPGVIIWALATIRSGGKITKCIVNYMDDVNFFFY